MKVLFLISYYKIGDGASTALREFIKCSPFIDEYVVLCKWRISSEQDIRISTLDEVKLNGDFFLMSHFEIIHYFKTRNSDIFNRVIKMKDHYIPQTPVLTTVCQRPSYKSLLLSPFEIRNSSCIILIDKASYNDSIIRFISESRKKQIYLSGDFLICEQTSNVLFKSNKTDSIIFGRGSTLAKCPLNMIDIFDKIDVPNKIFCIVGIPKGDNWVRKKAKGRTDIIIYDQLPYEEWFKVCSSFDVCLYQIPKDSHASLDANLGLPMLMRKPVVFYGSDAHKERFIHGINGFVANSYDEIVEYATLLGKDENLRKSIGENARQTTIELMESLKQNPKFMKTYYNLKPAERCNIPLWYRLFYFYRCYRSIIRLFFNLYPLKVN
jgi:hypothetical protein